MQVIRDYLKTSIAVKDYENSGNLVIGSIELELLKINFYQKETLKKISKK